MLHHVTSGARRLTFSLDPCQPRLQAVVHHGGFAATAAALGWTTQRRQRSAWACEHAVAAELRRFIREVHAGEGQLGQHRGLPGKPALRGRHTAAGQGEGEDDAAALPPGAKMPTHRELLAAGRHDLRWVLHCILWLELWPDFPVGL